MKKEITALIPVRLGSTRFPRKALASLHGKPMLERMIERIRRSKKIGNIVIATTDRPEDQELQLFSQRLGIECYQGSSEDVLGRMLSAAQEFGADPCVMMLGDNPLVHSDLIDDVIRLFEEQNLDFAANATKEYQCLNPSVPQFPVGLRVQVIRYEAFKKCEKIATSSHHREHATSYFTDYPNVFKIGFLQAQGLWKNLNRPDLTFAVNFKENLEMLDEIFGECYKKDHNFSVQKLLEIFDKRPHLVSLMGNTEGLCSSLQKSA
ncbi:MAG: NTP transferase domain-containing protein [Deltaproteobacteria bacterium]|nr:NTP transferase domain-containing protein [Deltaproteobacteria bacterium]